MENCAPFAFLWNWALVVSYLCSRFRIFHKPILEEYVSQVEGGPHLLLSCFLVAQDNLPSAVRRIHHSFESLVIINALGLQAFFMDIHNNTSFRSILENDFISFTSKSSIRSCLNKGMGLWLIVKPSITNLQYHKISIKSL